MSAQYSRDHCKIAVAKILQTLGWHAINSTPLEVLTDILVNHIKQISKLTTEYANEFGQTDPNLDHVGLAFQEMGISLSELEEYTTYVNFIPPASNVPKFPIPKESNLNFLKPGSKEVVTRPVYINEHLPPMYPLLEGSESQDKFGIKEEITIEENEIDSSFKKPEPEFRKIKKEDETGSRPTREISSVMMTTSGFISPAREGKLPEAKAPAPPPPPVELPPPTPTPPEPPIKKKVEKKKEKPNKDLFKQTNEKKLQPLKDSVKMKQKQPIIPASSGVTLTPIPMEFKQQSPVPVQKTHKDKMAKALAAAKAKTLKLNTTITPIPAVPPEKLLNEPDKKKVDIFKKISNKPKKDSRSNTPNLIMDEATNIVNKITHLSSDITIEPIINNDFGMDQVPPVAPKTPDIVINSPPMQPEKRKRKDPTTRKPKKPKKSDFVEPGYMDMMERPKTPDVLINRIRPFGTLPYQFPFIPNFAGPGLIPPQIFPFSQFPSFPPRNPYFPPVNVPPPLQPDPVPLLSPKNKESAVEIKPVEPPPTLPQPIQVPELNSSTNPAVPAPEIPSISSKKEHKKEKKDKIKKMKKKNKDKKDKLEKKKKLKELKKEGKEKLKKKKKDKTLTDNPIQKIILKVNSPSPRPETPESTKKLNIKPVKEPDIPDQIEHHFKREPSPSGLAKISALVTGPPKPKPSPVEDATPTPAHVPPSPSTPKIPRQKLTPTKPKPKPKKIEQPFKKIDEQGNEVWICPACGQQDDGRPMIGCDGCDAWYHWVCVGIQVPPDENENWYCKPCLCRKNEDLQSDKKKKRKRKDKKEH